MSGLAGFQHIGYDYGFQQSAGLLLDHTTLSAYECNDTQSWQTNTPAAGSALSAVWQHVLGYWDSVYWRGLYVNGTLAASDGSSVSQGPQSFNTMAVATMGGTIGQPQTAVAEAAFGSGTFTFAQIRALAAGANPLRVLPSQLLGYYPLRNSLEDLGPARRGLIGGQMGQSSSPIAPNPVWSEHPRVASPPRRFSLHRVAALPSTVRPRISMVA